MVSISGEHCLLISWLVLVTMNLSKNFRWSLITEYLELQKCKITSLQRKQQKQLPEVFYGKMCSQKFHKSHRKTPVPRNFAKFTGKHLRQSLLFNKVAGLCQNLFCNKVAGLRPATLLKKRLWHRCFLVNFAKILRILFL